MSDDYKFTMKELRRHLSRRGFGVRITTKADGRYADYFMIVKGKRVYCTFSNDKDELQRWECFEDFLAIFNVFLVDLMQEELINCLNVSPWTRA